MRQIFYFILLLVSLMSCKTTLKIAGKTASNPLEKAMATHANDLNDVLSHPEIWETQIIYTQIDRDENNHPTFKSYRWNVDSSRYFYPASTVKMPLAFLALERVNELKKYHPRLTKDTPYMLDSLREFQQKLKENPLAPNKKPSISQDIREIFAVSDNLAYNHLFEFLGRKYINETLQNKGYTRTGIVHRFNFSGRDNRYTSPMMFYDPTVNVYQQGVLKDETEWKNPQHSTIKGKGYQNAKDSLVNIPFEMGKKNWFAITDMEQMLKSVIFPEAVPAKNRFNLTPEDYQFLYRYMGLFPRECDYPKYDTVEHYDGYVKFFLFGDSKSRQNGKIRLFNKVGEAYGTLTDIAYIVDYEHNTEFFLTATLLCNQDGIFNDDKYDYDNVGFPFLSKLGKAVHEYDVKRPRKYPADLSKFKF
jgi:hypothetical protein